MRSIPSLCFCVKDMVTHHKNLLPLAFLKAYSGSAFTIILLGLLWNAPRFTTTMAHSLSLSFSRGDLSLYVCRSLTTTLHLLHVATYRKIIDGTIRCRLIMFKSLWVIFSFKTGALDYGNPLEFLLSSL